MIFSTFKLLKLCFFVLAISVFGILPVLAQDPEEEVSEESHNKTSSSVLLVTVTPDRTEALIGDLVLYNYVIANNTSETLTITGIDNKLGSLVWIPSGSGTFGPPALVPPGEQATATASYTILSSDLPGPFTNTVAITGTTPGSMSMLTVFNAEATASVELLQTFSVDPNDTEAQTMSSSDNVLTLIVPPAALPANAAEVRYVPRTTPPAGSSYHFPFAGVGFSLELLDGTGNLIPNPSFHPPLFLTLSYDDVNLPFNATGANEDKLMVYVLDESTGLWQDVPVISRDTVGNTITVYLSHFTDYALGGQRVMFLPTIRRSN
ncbi:MAG: hypothetical protein AAF629_00945 [Chloroflexota bacterium]